jgi:hypothetical protein
MTDLYEIANLKTDKHTHYARNEYALSDIVKRLNVLPRCLLKYVSEYCGTDSPDKVLELVKSFDINTIYEISYYCYHPYDILEYLNKKYKTAISCGCCMLNQKFSDMSFSYNLIDVGRLHVVIESMCKNDMYRVGYILHIMVTNSTS